MKNTKDTVLELLRQLIYTEGHNNGVETSLIAEKLKMQRSNVSSLLNSLVKDGEVIKDDSSRPVLYRLNDSTVNNDCCVFDGLIGCKESLKNAIQLAKAAVLYPNKSLNVLLTSPRGAGRSYFAYNIYYFARESHVIRDNAPFIKINCKFYEKNIEDSNDDLFGLNDDINKSCFNKARGGVLFIDNFNLLNPRQQSRILYYLETGLLFDDDYKNYIEIHDLMVIIGCSLNEVNNLSNKFSVVIELPAYVDKSLNERFELINYFFSVEAKNSARSIEVSDEAIVALLLSEFSFNIKELQNSVKSACANAYVRVVNENNSNILVNINDFSGSIKRNLLKRKDYGDEIEILIKGQKNIYYSKDTGYLNPSSISDNSTVYRSINEQYVDMLNRGINLNNIESVINSQISALFKSYSALNFVNSSENLDELSKIVDKKIIFIVRNFLNVFQNNSGKEVKSSVFYGLCLHINSLKSTNVTTQRIDDVKIKDIIENHPLEYGAAVNLSPIIKKELDIDLPMSEIAIIAMFLIDSNENEEKGHPVLLYIMHGTSTARSLAEVTNTLTQTNNAYAYDMNLSLPTKQAYDEIKNLILRINQGPGVIIIYDMGSIKTMLDNMSEEIDVALRVINFPITIFGIDIARRCEMEQDIDYIHHVALSELNKTMNDSNQKKAIITLCQTGMGGALQLKRYIDTYSKLNYKTFDLAISDRDILFKKVIEIKNTYQIHAFVGTYDPKLMGIPFIPISKVFEVRNEDLDKVLMFEPIYATSANYAAIYTRLESEFKYTSISKLKAVLPDIVDNICIAYNLSEEEKLGLFMHLACMIERNLSGVKLPVNNKELEKIELYPYDYKMISKFLKNIEKSFKIIIDDTEIMNIITICRKLF
ncbi:MAG: PRD domain-containing protein [Erysipelotrichaceae bacterium]